MSCAGTPHARSHWRSKDGTGLHKGSRANMRNCAALLEHIKAKHGRGEKIDAAAPTPSVSLLRNAAPKT